ncbi:PASTA domain-containing protein [Borrelia turicatae]|uniref:PASTA domain-containing protein n=1 Tax=Borrelia turicatae TaxID=142 RepID=A0A172XAN4_BORTU|nr:PASTA domain-containing protein [Borrelia turicatae]ANF33577.1 PASTA domain-containing protein [Borrelia turicatae]
MSDNRPPHNKNFLDNKNLNSSNNLCEYNENFDSKVLTLPKHVAKGLILTIFGSLIISCAIFFIFLKSNDIVVVPNLSELYLEDAITELQNKELIPYVELKFSSTSLDKGKVIDQNPKAGTVLRLDSKVKIFISKGAVINKVDSFIGKNIDDVLINLKANSINNNRMFYHLLKPIEIESTLPKGTIIRQEPSPGTKISSLVDLQFLVSKGQGDPPVKYVKNYIGLYYKDAIISLLNDEIDFDVNLSSGNDFGSVIFQSLSPGSKIENLDKLTITINEPRSNDTGVFGFLTYKLDMYPSSVDIMVKIKDPNGSSSLLYSFRSKGGLIKLPYEALKGSIIELYIYDRLVNQTVVN